MRLSPSRERWSCALSMVTYTFHGNWKSLCCSSILSVSDKVFKRTWRLLAYHSISFSQADFTAPRSSCKVGCWHAYEYDWIVIHVNLCYDIAYNRIPMWPEYPLKVTRHSFWPIVLSKRLTHALFLQLYWWGSCHCWGSTCLCTIIAAVCK